MPKKKTSKKVAEPFDSAFVTNLLQNAINVKAGKLIEEHTPIDAIYMFSLMAYIPEKFTYQQDGKTMHSQDRLGFVLKSGETVYYINGQENDLDRIANSKSSGWKFEIPADGVSCITPEEGGHLFLTDGRYTTLYFMSDLSIGVDN